MPHTTENKGKKVSKLKKILCRLLGHQFTYLVDDGEVDGVEYVDEMNYEVCQRCGIKNPNYYN